MCYLLGHNTLDKSWHLRSEQAICVMMYNKLNDFSGRQDDG